MRRQKKVKWLFGYFVSLYLCYIVTLMVFADKSRGDFLKIGEVYALDAQALYVKGLDVDIRILEDTSLEVEEKLLVHFPDNYNKNSFEWNLSKNYKDAKQNLRRSLKINSVAGLNGVNYRHDISQSLDDAKLTIISDNKLSGESAFKINYLLSKYIDDESDYDVITWTALGENKYTPIAYANVIVNSPFADVVEASCFAGDVSIGQRMCLSEFDKNQARYYSTATLGEGKDLVYTVGIRKESSLKYPTNADRFVQFVKNNIEKILIISLIITLVLALMVFFFRKRRISIRIRRRGE